MPSALSQTARTSRKTSAQQNSHNLRIASKMLSRNSSALLLISGLFMFMFPSAVLCESSSNTDVSTQSELFTIVGKVNSRMDELDLDNTRILVNDGQYVGFLRADGTFSISGLPSSSYIVEVSSPKSVYEPVRVDINSKGKIRARRLNLLQPGEVITLHYPISFESKGAPNYFFKREQFRILDILMSPMVLVMVLPLLLMFVMPKLISADPELQKDLEKTTSIFTPNQNQMPNLSEIMNKMLPGADVKKPSAANKPLSAQRQASRGDATNSARRNK